MPTFQGTLFFQDLASSYGFTESYYMAAADIAAARTKLQDLVPIRLEVLTDLHNMVAARVSDVDILNDSLLITGFPLPGQIVATTLSQCEPWTALLTRNESSSLYRGRTFFHGLLEDTFTSGRLYDPGNANNAAWQILFDWIRDNCSLKHVLAAVAVYDAFTNILPLRQVNRKVGRPFNLLHGRRPTAA